MTRFVCDRTDDQCKIVQERLLQQDTKHVLPINRIQSAQVARRQSDNNALYQAVLETDDGTISLSRASSSWRYPHARAVNQINQFLEDAEQQQLQWRFGQFGLFLFSLPLLVGLALPVLSRPVIDLTIDPLHRDLKLQRRRWWQASGKEARIPLDQIDDVDVNLYRNSMKRKRSTTYTTVIRLKSGEHVPLFQISKSKAFRHAAQLKAYLGK
ncbi:MAG: hypothetical protein EA367_21230 [Leptolyngbya sp. DLM2.Bin15]|nr:MAG: hypothetical protein EA367_21230 [Leptolyngbya sp. DLM2.Bin15]